MKYTPEDGLKDKSEFIITPVSEDAAREQFQRLFDQVKTQMNALMAALENSEAESSGAGNIGIEPVAGVTGTTVLEMIQSLKTQINGISAGSLSANIVETEHIKAGAVTLAKMAAGSVNTDQLLDGAVTANKMRAGTITADKLGVMQKFILNMRPDVGTSANDNITYDTELKKLKLNVAGLTSTQLAPVVYGTSATPPAGTYPPGTIYVQYVA